MKFNGRSGVQLRAPQDLADLAAYTSLKFYLQHPEPAPGQVAGDQFVLYMGSRQVPGGPGGRGGAGRRDGVGGLRWVAASLALPPHRLPATTWAWLCVTRKCTGCTASGARAPPLSASTRTSGSSLPLSESTGGRPSCPHFPDAKMGYRGQGPCPKHTVNHQPCSWAWNHKALGLRGTCPQHKKDHALFLILCSSAAYSSHLPGWLTFPL